MAAVANNTNSRESCPDRIHNAADSAIEISEVTSMLLTFEIVSRQDESFARPPNGQPEPFGEYLSQVPQGPPQAVGLGCRPTENRNFFVSIVDKFLMRISVSFVCGLTLAVGTIQNVCPEEHKPVHCREEL